MRTHNLKSLSTIVIPECFCRESSNVLSSQAPRATNLKPLITGLIFLIASLCFLIPQAHAAPSERVLNFQAKLEDVNTGAPLNGAQQLTFALYDTQTPGTGNLIWQIPSAVNVDAKDGICNAEVGPLPESIDFNQQYYLEIAVNGETLSERQKIAASPYALNAARLEGEPVSSFVRLVEVDDKNIKNSIDLGAGTLLITHTGYTEVRLTRRGLTMKNIFEPNSGWARALLEYTDNTEEKSEPYFGIGARGNGQKCTRFWIGKTYKDADTDMEIWFDQGSVDEEPNPAKNRIVLKRDVGIGTYFPTRKLHVKDVMRLQPRSTAPDNPATGDLYVSGDGNIHCYLRGDWRQLNNN